MSELWLHLDRIKCYQTDEYGDDEIFINVTVGGEDTTVWGPREMNEGTHNKTNLLINKHVLLAGTGASIGAAYTYGAIKVYEDDPESDADLYGTILLPVPYPHTPGTSTPKAEDIYHGDAHYKVTFKTYWT